MPIDRIPPLSADLIEKLRETYPRRAQANLIHSTQSDLGIYCGQQSVIEMLERLLAESAESHTVLTGSNVQ